MATLGTLRTHLGDANRAWAEVAGVTDGASKSMARAGAALSTLEHGTRAAEQSVLNWSGGLTKAGVGLQALTEVTERAVRLGQGRRRRSGPAVRADLRSPGGSIAQAQRGGRCAGDSSPGRPARVGGGREKGPSSSDRRLALHSEQGRIPPVIRRSRLARNRDIALTTLIDLLVQIIFVFTLILVSADVMGNESHERGWVTPEVWKTLISIFDIDPRTIRDAGAQVTEIKGKYEKVKDDLLACDTKTGACDKQAGKGPGNPPCRNSAGIEMVVAETTIDREGRIVVARGRHAGRAPGPATAERRRDRCSPVRRAVWIIVPSRGASTVWRVTRRVRSRPSSATMRAPGPATTSPRAGPSPTTSLCRRRRGASEALIAWRGRLCKISPTSFPRRWATWTPRSVRDCRNRQGARPGDGKRRRATQGSVGWSRPLFAGSRAQRIVIRRPGVRARLARDHAGASEARCNRAPPRRTVRRLMAPRATEERPRSS